jgi:hypothetical protein
MRFYSIEFDVEFIEFDVELIEFDVECIELKLLPWMLIRIRLSGCIPFRWVFYLIRICTDFHTLCDVQYK